MQPVRNISPQNFATEIESSASVTSTLIDVREPWEFQIAHIEGAVLHPLGQINEWAQPLNKSASYVVMCHHGGRSAMACQILQGLGFTDVKNLDGGINAWSYVVNPSIARY